MMYGRQSKMLLVLLGACLVAGTALATNITISDENIGTGGYYTTNWWAQTNEDQETEPGTIDRQGWDLEGMFITGTTLTMVGGWNFTSGGPGSYNYVKSGDIFIDITGDAVFGTGDHSLAHATGAPANASTAGATVEWDWGYDYAIKVDWTNKTYQVFNDLQQMYTTNVTEGINNPDSSPWVLASGGGGPLDLGGGIFTGTVGTPNADGYGFLGDSTSDDHYAVSFDLSWLLPVFSNPLATNGAATFHFTQACGNDTLMGRAYVNGGSFIGTPPVPEPASMGILGMGLLGLVATRLRKK